jgi:hypothetical protein
MKNKKQTEKRRTEKSYSYDEFVREFYPNQERQTKRFEQNPREFGKTLAEDAVKTIREHLSHR